MTWNLTSFLRRHFLKPARRKPIRRTFRPRLESLEDRLTPSNVDVTTFHNDPAITGQNLQETALTPQNVNSTNFGQLANVKLDGYVYAQPLYVANLMINGVAHNVAFVATEHDSVYAFDVKNDPSSPTGVTLSLLWQRSFISGGPGGPTTPGITTVPNSDVLTGDIVPEIGITGAPAIDPATNTLYVVAKTKEERADGTHYVQTLHALDITNGQDKYITSGNGGYVIGDSHGDSSASEGFANQTTAITVPGAGADTSGGANPTIAFDAFVENQRPSLLLLNGRVYVSWASHGDNGPYHGWVVGFNETTLQPEKVFNDSPNTRGAGIWQSEGGLSTDGTNLYFAVGNAFANGGPFPGFDPAAGNYSESVIKLDTTQPGMIMPVADYFTPFNWQTLDARDADLGSGGVMLLPDSVGSAAHPHLMVETGKDGHIYLLDRDNMGKLNPDGVDNNQIVQDVVAGPGGVWGNPAYYQLNATTGLIYYHGSGSDTRVFEVSNGQIQQISTSNSIAFRSNQTFGFPGAQPIISANGADNPSSEIDWELQVDNYASQGTEELHAYALPTNLTAPGTLTELYNSNQTGQRDQPGSSVKFTSPIVTNGLVMFGTENSFAVYGLFPTHTAVPTVPTNLTGQGVSPTSIQLTWTNPTSITATGIKIFRSSDGGATFTQVNTVAATATSYTDTGLNSGVTYIYEIAATNQVGDSPLSNAIVATPALQPPVPTVTNATSANVTLSWSAPPVANNHYSVLRSTDGVNFTPIATGLTTTTFTDSAAVLTSAPGLYYYEVVGFTDASGTLSATSNPVPVKVGPNSGVIDDSNGFPLSPALPPDLQANGNAAFADTTARLTSAVNQTGSVFSTNEENILNWSTTFQVRLHEGTQPNYADGFAFVIQADGANALGQRRTGLGYQGLANSLAIKFDTQTGAAENGTGGSTGLFVNGDNPSNANPTAPGEVNIPLDATMVNLESQSNKTITLSYAYNAANPSASILTETILDSDHPDTPFTHQYMVDIPSLLGTPASGNTIGFVGFTGSTGPGNWELEDILNFKFTPTGPAAPHNLTATANAANTTNNLAWTSTSADDSGFIIQRSTSPTSGFTTIATVGAGVTTFTDSGLTNATQFFYRVQAFNNSGTGGTELDSGFSNIAQATPTQAAKLAVSVSSATDTAGQSVQVTVAALDQSGNPFPGYTGTVHFTSTDQQAGLPADYTFMAADNGVHTFTVTLKTAGTDSITATDTATGTITGSAFVGVSPAAASTLAISTSGSPITAGTADNFTVIARDAFGNIATGYTGTLHFTSNDPQAGLPADYSFTVGPGGDNGVHTFTATLKTAGIRSFTATDTATSSLTSTRGGIQVNPGVAVQFVVTGYPSSTVKGDAHTFTVTAVDAFGNIATGYTGTVHFTSSDKKAVLPQDYTFTAGDGGVHTFSATFEVLGFQSLTVTDSKEPTLTGTEGGIDVVNKLQGGSAVALPNSSESTVSSSSASSGTTDTATLNSLVQNLTSGGAAVAPAASGGSSSESTSNVDGVLNSSRPLDPLSAFYQALYYPGLRRSSGTTDQLS